MPMTGGERLLWLIAARTVAFAASAADVHRAYEDDSAAGPASLETSPAASQLLLSGVLFLIENAFGISVAVTMLLLFCGLTRLFISEADEEEGAPASGGGAANAAMANEPRPRWEVLRVLNYLVITLFVSSITYVVVNYRTMAHVDGSTNGQLFPILVIWSCCMAYFFGFFGISFLDKNAMARSPSSFGLGHLDQQLLQQSAKAAKTAVGSPAAGHRAVLQSPHGGTGPVKSVAQHLSPPGAGGKPAMRAAPSAAANLMCAKEGIAAASMPPSRLAGPAAILIGASGPRTAATPAPLPPVPEGSDYAAMADDEVVACVESGRLKDHQLEALLGDHARAVVVRRRFFERRVGVSLGALPHAGYDYGQVFGANCEIVCGYVPLPVGIVGPLLLNGKEVYVPMATTEGCLVASTNRGCKAVTQGGGARAAVLKDGITRAPCLRLPDAMQAAALKQWAEDPRNWEAVRSAFESTTNFGKLTAVKATVAGRNVYLRLVCFSGDAMGMNMVSKGCLAVVELLESIFPQMELIAISGNMCTDKKPAAVNWIEGRGKSVVCEARIPGRHVEATLKTTVRAMVETNLQKNLIGSAMAGALGGFNAHASNVVTAVFLATGQDPAQNVESSTCITLMEETDAGDLLVSVNMPSIEVGTVGGGTSLPAQAVCLDVVGCRGASRGPGAAPGANAQQMAMVVAAAVLAGEVSLVAALASNQLVRAHMQHNRKKT